RLHHVLQEEFQAAISLDTIWRRLRAAGLTSQKPERHYVQADDKIRKVTVHVSGNRRRAIRSSASFTAQPKAPALSATNLPAPSAGR
ncbi:MAG: winged helix-turn-helix domain-containing protein, partial [Planctomycetes bacterium]|nr:winged helix-turn-helix domain-containing protein [Planctomycetota bacterium]